MYLLQGPQGSYSDKSMICRDLKPNPDSSTYPTITAGSEFRVDWSLVANHPGECYLYLSYGDGDKVNPQKWIKIANFLGCGKVSGALGPACASFPPSPLTTPALPPRT